MRIVDLVQGTEAWHSHRAKYFNASDCAAMMGCSPYLSRDALIKQRATGVSREFSEWVQEHVLNRGHRIEALTRPHAEKIIGEDLSPVIGVDDTDTYSASFDGITLACDESWENKSVNEAIRQEFEDVDDADISLPMYLRVQMEHQLIVSGGEKTLFTAAAYDDNDQQTEFFYVWYYPDAELRRQIIAGWKQLQVDIDNFVDTPEPEVLKADPVEMLPMPVVQAEGRIIKSNMAEIIPMFDKYLAELKTDLQTDQDFAEAAQHAKTCKKMEGELKRVVSDVIGQMAEIAEVQGKAEHYFEKIRQSRLELERQLKTKKQQIKESACLAAKDHYLKHIDELEQGLLTESGVGIPVNVPDFGKAISGLKTLTSMHERINDALAKGKIEANEIGDDYTEKLKYITPAIKGYEHLFRIGELITKDIDFIKLHIADQIRQEDERKAEAIKAEEERKAAEEAARAEREAEAERLKAQEAERQKAAEIAAEAQEAAETSVPTNAGRQVHTESSAPLAESMEFDPANGETMYVYIVEDDSGGEHNGQSMIWEHSIPGMTTLEGIKTMRAKHAGKYGRTRIAKLVYVDDDGNEL